MKQAVDDYDIVMADYYRKRDSEVGDAPKETNWSS